MTDHRSPRVGIIADSNLQRLALAQVIKVHGYELGFNSSPERIDDKSLGADVDVWVVDLAEEDEVFLDRLLDHTSSPILFGIEQAPPQGTRNYPRWERKVFVKLRDMVGSPQVVETESLNSLETTKPPTPLELPPEVQALGNDGLELVCVLAASLGGPAAVKEFLDCLPRRLPVAFVLAQHIDERMQDTLAHILVRHNGMKAKVAKEGDRLAHGEVMIAPVGNEIDFDADGQVIVRNMKWDGPYAPSIDQTIANITRRFGKRSGAVIFSGMGGDGSISGPMMQDAGGFIWAQSAESCACSSQPDSMRGTGCVTYNGTPSELAAHLMEHIRTRIAVPA